MPGTAIDSVNAGNGWDPENAFGGGWIWGGRPDSEGFVWVGKIFGPAVTVRCVKIHLPNWDGKGVTEVRIQAYIEGENRWENA